MGKQSKTKTKTNKQNNYIEETPCDICFDTILARRMKLTTPENGTTCGNGHSICMECAKKLIKPSICFCAEEKRGRNDDCCGFYYCCPICRMDACVNRYQLYAILKSSHKVATKDFTFDDTS